MNYGIPDHWFKFTPENLQYSVNSEFVYPVLQDPK